MRSRTFLYALVLLCMCIFHVTTVSASAGDSDTANVALVKHAVRRWLCWDKYWGWGPYDLGHVSAAKIKFDQKAFYVWIDDIVVTDKVRMAAFYTGRIKDGQAAVILREAFGTGYIPPKPKKKKGTYESGGPAIIGPGLPEERKAIFETGRVISTDISVPIDCTPHFDPPTKEKGLMVATIVKTMRSFLARSFSNGSLNSTRVKLMIANFNVDYPSTYVLIEPSNKVWVVALHDLQDYYSHTFEKVGAYPANEVLEPSAVEVLIPRIKKNSIVKEIDIEGGGKP